MGNFTDFQALKEKVSFEQAIGLLQLQMKRNGNQWRGVCPACKGSGERALVVTESRGAYCFSASKGGDQIWLVSHVMGTDVKAAAKLLSDSIDSPKTTVPQVQPSGGAEKGGMTPLAYLEHAHEAVIALGFDAEVAKKIGIGYAPKGLCRGKVAVPIRDETGKLLGYIGLEDPPWLPADFQSNVVVLKRPA